MRPQFDLIRDKIKTSMANKKKRTPKSNARQPVNPCWDGYKKVGMKIKRGKNVPNCVPKKKRDDSQIKQRGIRLFAHEGKSSTT